MLDELDLFVIIDDENTKHLKRGSFAKSAPNQIIYLKEIVKIVDANLEKYKQFFKSEIHLNKGETTGFCTDLSITCKGCAKIKLNLLRKIWCLKQNLDEKLPEYEKDTKVRRKYQQQLSYEKKTYEKIIKANMIDTLLLDKYISTYENKSSKIAEENNDAFNLPEVNLRTMMARFYIGSGPHDIGSALSFLGNLG